MRSNRRTDRKDRTNRTTRRYRDDISIELWSSFSRRKREAEIRNRDWLMNHHVVCDAIDHATPYSDRVKRIQADLVFDDIDPTVWVSAWTNRDAEIEAKRTLLHHHVPSHPKDKFDLYSKRVQTYVTRKRVFWIRPEPARDVVDFCASPKHTYVWIDTEWMGDDFDTL